MVGLLATLSGDVWLSLSFLRDTCLPGLFPSLQQVEQRLLDIGILEEF